MAADISSMRTFTGSFTQQEPIPDNAIEAAVKVLRSGRLHRYNVNPGEIGETASLEREFAGWQGRDYCLAVASGGQAMQIALRAAGVQPGEPVLTNAFTLAPVPGAVHSVGAQAILVETNEDLRIDLNDLAAKAAHTSARTLLLSMMRGHVPDMDRVMAIAENAGLMVIEDCAHTMGATWTSRRSGNFGRAACFSTQTYKHINSGEGGLLVSDDPNFMARATVLSGSYMLYDRHGAGPGRNSFEAPRYDMANLSARMDNLRAAILRPQLALLEDNIKQWNRRYRMLASALSNAPAIVLPKRPDGEGMVGSSLQFRVPELDQRGCERLVARSADRGVEIKWFGRQEPAGFTSTHHSWRYLRAQSLPRTDAVLAQLFDLRLPLTFKTADCAEIGEILCTVINSELS